MWNQGHKEVGVLLEVAAKRPVDDVIEGILSPPEVNVEVIEVAEVTRAFISALLTAALVFLNQ